MILITQYCHEFCVSKTLGNNGWTHKLTPETGQVFVTKSHKVTKVEKKSSIKKKKGKSMKTSKTLKDTLH